MTGQHISGGCHCGNITYVFETTAPLETLGLRACTCSFCRAHANRTTSDPNGAFRIRAHKPERLSRYSFGLKTADFLICSDCGVFVGALMELDGGAWLTVNANSFQPPPPADFPLVPHEFGGEDTGGRIARRKERWTPVVEAVL